MLKSIIFIKCSSKKLEYRMDPSTGQATNYPTISVKNVMRPTYAEVDLNRMRNNFQAVRFHVGETKIMAILKANAYGHGLVRIALFMEEIGADYIGVAVLEEGMLLREMGITLPILVLGGILGNQVAHFIEHDLTMTASSLDILTEIDEAAKSMGRRAKVHVKIDTGLERIGVHYYYAEPFLLKAAQCNHIDVEGIFTHFANANAQDLTHARLQLQRFRDVLAIYQKHSIEPPRLRHIANSSAVLQLPEAKFDMVRAGLLLYGIYPTPAMRDLIDVRPALRWKSRVVFFKVIRPGHPVGYGSTWETDHPTRAVIVPVGYGDGFFRAMSNRAEVIIHGKRYPVIGRISMDQIIVNIDQDSAYAGDEVVLLGEMGEASIWAEDLAEWANTSNYEILTNINTRVPRVYID